MTVHEQNEASGAMIVASRYALLNRIGVGGMGEVWQAHDRITHQTVAVKVLKPSIAGAPAAELRFMREIRAMARLKHDRVVPVLDAGNDPVVGLFFVMALQDGRPLHEVARQWTSWRQVWPMVDQILETLAYTHAHGVIHRDIKPDNILINTQGESVLLDFGVARLKDHARSGTSAYDMLGTVDYAAPEQATGNRRRIGPWTDLYCFGIVLYEMVCARLPFWASSAVQSLMMRLDRGCPKLDPRPGFSTPKGLWDVLNRLMQPRTRDRVQHAFEARRLFAAIVSGPYEMINPPVSDPAAYGHGTLSSAPELTDAEAETLLQQRSARYAQNSDGSLVARPLEAPLPLARLCGRQTLLRQLLGGLERWVKDPKPGVLTLCGPKGIGKTRIATELVTPFLATARLRGHLHRWRSGKTVSKIALGIAGAIGLSEDATREHMRWFLDEHGMDNTVLRDKIIEWCVDDTGYDPEREQRRFAAFMSVVATPERPFVLTIDGLRYINPTTRSLIRAARAWRIPVIVVLTTEHALVEEGAQPPRWLGPSTRALGPLADEALGEIVDAVAELESSQRDGVLEEAAGCPQKVLHGLVTLCRRGEIVPAHPRWIPAPAGWLVGDPLAASMEL